MLHEWQVLYYLMPQSELEPEGLGRQNTRMLGVSSTMLNLFQSEPLVQQHMVRLTAHT